MRMPIGSAWFGLRPNSDKPQSPQNHFSPPLSGFHTRSLCSPAREPRSRPRRRDNARHRVGRRRSRRAKLDVAVTQVDRQLAADDKEEVVGLVVLVPDERALDLDDLKLVVVDEPDDARLVRLPEQRQLFRKVDLLVYVGRSGSRSPLERLGSGAGGPARRAPPERDPSTPDRVSVSTSSCERIRSQRDPQPTPGG